MSNTGRTLVRAILAVIACIWAAGGTADAAPALWTVKSGDSVVYLFGTVHVVKSGVAWQTPAIINALAQSQELWLEEIDDDPTTVLLLIKSLGFDDAHPLSSKLSPTDLARVDAAARAAGFPDGEAEWEHRRPWLVALSLAERPIIQAGYDPKLGVDKALEVEAKGFGRQVHAFETLKQQMHFFSDLPQAVEVQFLESTLDDVAEGPAKVDELFAAWSSGDMAALDRLFIDLTQEKYRELYDVLIVQRNRAWAAQIADWIHAGKGPIFVAVGAGHFTGSDSLLNLLAQRGLHVERQ